MESTSSGSPTANHYRSAKSAKRIHILRGSKPQRDSTGKIIKAAAFQNSSIPNTRIEPNRKWFQSTRVISQSNLDAFRKAIAKSSHPYHVLLKSNKLPLSLLKEPSCKAKIHTSTPTLADVFGPKAQRKRVKIEVEGVEDLARSSEKTTVDYVEKNKSHEDGDAAPVASNPIFSKGQSKRIWNELYKVIDSSDVILFILDARDPLGTRCPSIERYLSEEAPHKHVVFILNKVDLIPTSTAACWVRSLSSERPTLAMHSSRTNPFGKGSLIALLRQFASLHSDKRQISVGLVGYPNTGKSSVANSLRGKKVASVAPLAGETQVLQWLSLTRKISLVDCPGVVPPDLQRTPEDLLLRGAVRVENAKDPEQYIPAVLARVEQRHLERTYDVSGWTSHLEFLEMLARKNGRLLQQGQPDVNGVARIVLNDFIRGKIPWFIPCSREPAAVHDNQSIN